MARFCTVCGRQANEGDLMCRGCGSKLPVPKAESGVPQPGEPVPGYSAPPQPEYNAPTQPNYYGGTPGYNAPPQPEYTAPTQPNYYGGTPGYSAPPQPEYNAPSQPGYYGGTPGYSVPQSEPVHGGTAVAVRPRSRGGWTRFVAGGLFLLIFLLSLPAAIQNIAYASKYQDAFILLNCVEYVALLLIGIGLLAKVPALAAVGCGLTAVEMFLWMATGVTRANTVLMLLFALLLFVACLAKGAAKVLGIIAAVLRLGAGGALVAINMDAGMPAGMIFSALGASLLFAVLEAIGAVFMGFALSAMGRSAASARIGASSYSASTAPVCQLKTNRGLAKYIFLSIITFGIYGLVVMSVISSDINTVASRYDGRKTMHYCLVYFIFSWLTCGIVPLVWSHRISARIGRELQRRGIDYGFGAGTYWGWNILGSLIVVGPFIYHFKLFKSMNLLCEHFNRYG